MKDFDHLLSVWQGQPKQVRLSVDEVLKQVKKGLNRLKSKLLLTIIVALLLLAALVCVALFMPIKNSSTYIGLGIWITGLIISSTLQITNYRVISSLDVTTDPATYLSHLKVYRKRKAFMNGRFFYLYALAISLGLMFYMDEFIHTYSQNFKICFYAGWLIYLGFIIFYLKRKFIARENHRVALLIERLESLRKQFE